MTISYDDFLKVDIRCGTIVKCEEFPEARKPAYKLWIDFGAEIGVKKTSAQIIQNYTPDQLTGTKVMAVVNFPPKQVGPFMSEVLTLGFTDKNGHITLARPDQNTENGARLH